MLAGLQLGERQGARAHRERQDAIASLHSATAYYTAEPIVRSMLDSVRWPGRCARLLDASCGDGAFILEAVDRLLVHEPKASDAAIVSAVQGWEIFEGAAAAARDRLAVLLMARGRSAPAAQGVAAAIVHCGDFLLDGPRERSYDLIVGNPPFLRYANVPPLLRELYEQQLPRFSQGDMLHSFLSRTAEVLVPGGQVALVCSDRWLFSQSAADLRSVLGQQLRIATIERLDPASSFYRPKIRRAGQLPRIHPVLVVLSESGPQALTRAPIYPDALAEDGHDGSSAAAQQLQAVARVRLAPWLGPKGIFVVDRETAATLPAEHLVPAADTEAIRGGRYGGAQRFAIRTRRDTEPPAAILRHLEQQLHRMPASKRRSDKVWIPPESFEGMDLSAPSLLIPRIARTLRPVRVPAGVLPVDHGISIVSAGTATLDELEMALTQPQAEAWVRARAPRLEQGYFSLTTTLLRQLPVR